MNSSFWKNKRVLITGHTGFKGSWLCALLLRAGAYVTGYSLMPPTDPSLFELSHLSDKMNSVIGDIRDLESLREVFDKTKPEIVLHLAAQPIVREAYKNPVLTYDTNVMGTVNLLECIRNVPSVRSVINVTTDKVYRNDENKKPFTEDDFLCGYDPYSNSKSCSELVTFSYVNSFFTLPDSPAISTCRAGNVIGGGDFATCRLIPDCVRAVLSDSEMIIRNPNSIRPYQHVLEPLNVYTKIAERQFSDKAYAGCYNVGPDVSDCLTSGELVNLFASEWKELTGNEMKLRIQNDGGPREADFLKLDCTKLKKTFGRVPKLNAKEAVQMTAKWTFDMISKKNLYDSMLRQIEEYENHK